MSDDVNADMMKLIDKYVFPHDDGVSIDGCKRLMKAFATGFMSLFILQRSLREILSKTSIGPEEELLIWTDTMFEALKGVEEYDMKNATEKFLTKKD